MCDPVSHTSESSEPALRLSDQDRKKYLDIIRQRKLAYLPTINGEFDLQPNFNHAPEAGIKR